MYHVPLTAEEIDRLWSPIFKEQYWLISPANLAV
jgi:hypothetical protein